MNKDFLIKSKNGAVSSLTIALVYVIFIVVTLVTGFDIAKGYGALEYIFLGVAVVVICLDVVDLLKMKKDQLKVSFQVEKVVINSYWFSNKEYNYAEMGDIALNEKDITFTYGEKTKAIGYLSKSNLIRAMKILKDNCSN
ncbi:hypothetical protein KQ51_00939 [Candidatus Izimaplasma bacterium HR1]|jgi:ABC-type transport system involved in cytochrome bd biosynthesis fused ATPase/permease subunit|uniref:hypothetical protein n=1 Tax=Candidatus Izimoplasma sp. HR1 TaxID=1541959 RepID=UPI0004F7484D|nr:hypothetical protein KQ51_00939 [Candidatus Izimaplasma bacterium HR1]